MQRWIKALVRRARCQWLLGGLEKLCSWQGLGWPTDGWSPLREVGFYWGVLSHSRTQAELIDLWPGDQA